MKTQKILPATRQDLLCRGQGELLLRVFLLEPLHPTFGIHDLLCAGEKWVAPSANFDADITDGRPALETVSTSADNLSWFVRGVNAFFHNMPRGLIALAIHGLKKILIGLGALNLVYQKLHRLHRPQWTENLAQHPHFVETIPVH